MPAILRPLAAPLPLSMALPKTPLLLLSESLVDSLFEVEVEVDSDSELETVSDVPELFPERGWFS